MYGFMDGNGNVLTEDGVFGNCSKSALNNFLQKNGFSYFSSSARDLLLSDNAINASGGIGPIVTIGPDPYAAIKDAAVVDAGKMMDGILQQLSYGIWHNGYYFLAEDSTAYKWYEYLKMTVQNYNLVNSGAIIPASIIDSYNTAKKYGPMPPIMTVVATAILAGAKLCGYDDGMPDLSSAINIIINNQKKDVVIALAKFDYVMNSDYRYLMVGIEGRGEFLERLNQLSDQIQQSDYNIYSTSAENAAYKAALLDYVNKISEMNNNFDNENELFKA